MCQVVELWEDCVMQLMGRDVRRAFRTFAVNFD
jgi:hypothetical protein